MDPMMLQSLQGQSDAIRGKNFAAGDIIPD